MDDDLLKSEVARFMRRTYEKNLTASLSGNISARTSRGTIFITPAGVDKSSIQPDQVSEITMDGTLLTPGQAPTTEVNVHVLIYQKRKDVQAVFHAHPPLASSFAAMNRSINTKLLAESHVILGEPVITPYVQHGTAELGEVVSEGTLQSNVIIMQNHGVLTAGENLLDAFNRLEVLEEAAKITIITDLMHDKREIPPEELTKLNNLI